MIHPHAISFGAQTVKHKFQLGLFTIALLCFISTGCSEAGPAIDQVSQSVYVDSVSMQAVVADTTAQTPAINPATGKRTLQPALYCPKCQRWHAVPSIEQINRKPGSTHCPKTGVPMNIDGPWPT